MRETLRSNWLRHLRSGGSRTRQKLRALLASVGIAPKNGWIADYPVTPDIIGELEKAVSEAGDAKRLRMGKNEALKAFRTTAVELELPIIAEVPDGYAESPPPTAPQYTEPSVINNYYDTEGPPVVTYYPPPSDYYYMYAWIPSPFWYSGFYFPGFFVLHDFHRVIFFHKRRCVVTNHIRDHRTGRVFALDPARRHAGGIPGGSHTPRARTFNSTEARNGARSILERSRERAGSRRYFYRRQQSENGTVEILLTLGPAALITPIGGRVTLQVSAVEMAMIPDHLWSVRG